MRANRHVRLCALAAMLASACSAPDTLAPRPRNRELAASDAPIGAGARPMPALPLTLLLPMPAAAPAPVQPAGRPRPVLTGQLNLNTADLGQLVLLPGIGDRKA